MPLRKGVFVSISSLGTKRGTYTSKSGEDGCETFQMLCHVCKGEEVSFEEGVMPIKSIFMSPSISIGTGWAVVEDGTERGESKSTEGQKT